MIELLKNQLVFRFPDVHREANCTIDFQRTLRIPDDNREYPLPPGMGKFPVKHVDDFVDKLPPNWKTHGGVFLPMYQSEALWINFSGDYPCAIKVAAGKINAVSGESWKNELSANPQDYIVSPDQPWLDGFNVTEGLIRQFVAMPLGEGFTAEEQITDTAEHGGLQIMVYPMKAEYYARLPDEGILMEYLDIPECLSISEPQEMGLAPGGLMRQEICEDEYDIDAWDLNNGLRCFVHLANSQQYLSITGQQPPHKPPTAQTYTAAGLPWFDYYNDGKAIPGGEVLNGLTSVAAMAVQKEKSPLMNNDQVNPKVIKALNTDNLVRDGEF